MFQTKLLLSKLPFLRILDIQVFIQALAILELFVIIISRPIAKWPKSPLDICDYLQN